MEPRPALISLVPIIPYQKYESRIMITDNPATASAEAVEEVKREQEDSPIVVEYTMRYHTALCDCKDESCILAHKQAELRRKPELLPTGKWNYTPLLCQFGSLCRHRDKCKKAHTNDEVRFHPEIYKTEMCRFPLNPKGRCLEYGLHCPYAHHQTELRVVNYGRRGVPSPRVRGKTNRTAPPIAPNEVGDSVEILQLRQELEQLKIKALCVKCRTNVKEWLLNCGHLICGDCMTGVMHQCPACHAPLHKMRLVKLVDKCISA